MRKEDDRGKRYQYKRKIMMVTGDEKGKVFYTERFTRGLCNRLE